MSERTYLLKWYKSIGYVAKKITQKRRANMLVSITLMSKQVDHLYQISKWYNKLLVINNSVEAHMLRDESPKFLLVYSKNEVYRENNTGMLLQQMLKSMTLETIWERGKDYRLSGMLNTYREKGYQPVLVYKSDKSESDDLKSANHKTPPDTQCHSKRNLYIILDATWQEARGIMNQSDVLKSLPRVVINSNTPSQYGLRRNQVIGGLCTVEVALELIKCELPIEIYDRYARMIREIIRT